MSRTATARKINQTDAADAVAMLDTENPVGATKGNVTEIHPEPKVVAKALAEAKEPVSVLDQMKAHAEQVRAKQSAERKARTAKPAAEVAKPKASKPAAKAKEPKPKAEVKRVPAETFVAEVKRLGLTFTQAGAALGVSPSSVSEYVGKGRGHLMAQDRWADAKKAMAEYAKGLK